MITSSPGLARLAADLSLEAELAQAHRKIAKLEKLAEALFAEIAVLTQRRVAFDLSADGVAFFKPQAGPLHD